MTDGNSLERLSSNAPVRMGRIGYGSPRCCGGRVCTITAYNQATAEARELAEHLGPGWEPYVWENLGWHYRATLTSGGHTMHVDSITAGSHSNGGWRVHGYSAAFDNQFWNDAKTPEAAVIAVIAEIRSQWDSLGAVLAAARSMSPLLDSMEGVDDL